MAHAQDAPATPPRLHLFGSFRIERGDHSIHLPTRKVDALLAYLALHPEEHPREKLAALLWGDSSDDQARTSLRTALAVLRKHLGDDLLLADRDTVQINPDFPIAVDARRFTDLLYLESTRSRQSEILNLQAAVALYEGDLLADFYDDWVAADREHYRTVYIDTLLLLAQRMRARSEYARAIEFAQKVLATDAANERAHQHLMFCYLATGDRSAALKQFDECKRVLAEELGVEPAPETLALYESIKQASAVPQAREATLTNLPVPLTSFIGREQEVAQVTQLLSESRLLTLTGTGGIGKTRLAKQAAFDLVNTFRDGVWFVELVEVMDASLVTQAVAKVLGVRESPDQPIEKMLAAALASRSLLLILDNCEHLVVVCARLVEMLLSACPNLQVLTTSREVLGITGETIYQVPPLQLPDARDRSAATPEQLPALMQCDAVRLFAERAVAALPAFRLTPQNASTVAQICQRLDGIPLAIELAAARVKALTVEQIAERLDDRFRLLTGGSRTALPRYQTLRALIDWSYDLLSEPERALYRRLSVFIGGWTLEAAEAVCASLSVPSDQVLELQGHLVDKSLVRMEEQDDGPRYRFLETIRQYARDRLIESAEAADARNMHRDWYLHLAEEADPNLRGADQTMWLRRLATEHDNLRAALEWSLGRDAAEEDAEKGLRLAGALAQFWAMHGDFTEGRGWLDQALRRIQRSPAGSLTARARAFTGAGVLAYFQSDLLHAAELSEQGLALARQADDKWLISASLFVLGEYERNYRRDLPRAQSLMAEGLALAREIGDQWLTALSLYSLGLQARLQNDQELATSFLEESLELCRALQDHWLCGAVLDYLGEQAYLRGNSSRAAQLFEEGLALRRDLRDKSGIAGSLNNLGDVARSQNDVARAKSFYEESLALFREVGQTESIAIVLHNLGYVALRQADVPQAIAHFKASLDLFNERQDKQGISECHIGFAAVAASEGQPARAARLLGGADAMLESIHAQLPPVDRAEYAACIGAARAALGDELFDHAYAEGRTLSVDLAIAYALNP